MNRIVAALGLSLALALPALAQVDRATLSGTVKDPTGAIVGNASVTATHLATNVASKARTTGAGTFLLVNLASGQYLVEAEAAGFDKSAQSIVLATGQRAVLDFNVGLSGVTEAVTVEGGRQLLATTQANLGSVIDQTAVSKLPLAIRNWDDLLALVPGVQGDRFSEQGGGTSFGRTGGINVHGSRSLSNNYLLDGVDNNSISENVQELTTQVSRPSVDAIQEFKVATTPFSAEYGRSPGAAISVVTKSGTNQFRGTIYDYYRNEGFDSNDFISKRLKLPKPPNDQNQFGGNIGGPIIKSKAFFFADYEGTRITRGVTRLTRVPTASDRAGVFSGTVKDPLTGQPFPNNTIPAGRIDPYAASILALVPEANQPGNNNFARQADVEDNSDRILARLDVHASQSDSVFGRYIYSNRKRNIPGAFDGVLDGTGTSAFGNQTIKTHAFVGGWTHIFSPSVVNEFRFSWSKADSDAVQRPFGVAPPAGATIPGSITDPIVAGGLPGITIDGYFGGPGLGRIGSPDFLPKFQHTNQFEFINSVSWLKGNHALKIGADIIAPMKNEYLDIPAVRGALRFRNSFTGNSMADFLLGYVSDVQLSNVWVVDQRHWASMFFVQDDWKVSDKLSLNLGLRYDFITPALEADNAQTNFVPDNGGQLVFASDGSLEERGLVKPDRNNFAPRFGAVYKINEQTIVRGGFGVFYNLFDRVGSEDQLALNPPGLTNNSITQTSGSPVFLLRDGFPPNLLNPRNLDPAAGQLKSLRLRAVSNDAPKTTVKQASLGFQREVVRDLVLSVDGVWTEGSNLATLVNLNQPLPNAAGTGVSTTLPFPNFGLIQWRAQNGSSKYKGIDFGLEKRFSDGYSFGVAYTLSDSKDNTAEHLATGGSPSSPQDSRDFDAWYGPSGYDVRHRFVVNYVAELPFGEGKKWANGGLGQAILGGWTLSGIFTARTGRPFTVTQGNNNVGSGMTGLPNFSGGDAEGPKTVDQWFDKSKFTLVPSGTFGNAPRNAFRGPGYKSLDLTLSRRFGFTERVSATVRWDVFNVFNTTNLGLPGTNIADTATVGTITSLSGDARIMQLSVRLAF